MKWSNYRIAQSPGAPKSRALLFNLQVAYISQIIAEQFKGIAKDQGGGFVTEAHAIQAGREVRVIVDAKRAGDADAFAIAQNIAKKVEAEMTFPGEIKVTVLREVRAEATAR